MAVRKICDWRSSKETFSFIRFSEQRLEIQSLHGWLLARPTASVLSIVQGLLAIAWIRKRSGKELSRFGRNHDDLSPMLVTENDKGFHICNCD